MLKNPQDRRARRTASQIRETMFSFMETTPVHRISVSDICKSCQINRATFYDHYRDVFDLVQDMENEMLLEIGTLMEAVSPEGTAPEEVSRRFFAFLSDHRRKLQLLITSERSREFCVRLDHALMPFFEKKIRQSYEIPADRERELRSVMAFVANGYYRFFMLALTESGRSIASEAALCAKLSDACLEQLFEKKHRENGNGAAPQESAADPVPEGLTEKRMQGAVRPAMQMDISR